MVSHGFSTPFLASSPSLREGLVVRAFCKASRKTACRPCVSLSSLFPSSRCGFPLNTLGGCSFCERESSGSLLSCFRLSFFLHALQYTGLFPSGGNTTLVSLPQLEHLASYKTCCSLGAGAGGAAANSFNPVHCMICASTFATAVA